MVHDGDNINGLRMRNEEDAIGKAMNDGSTDGTTNSWILLRASLDLFNHVLNRCHKLCSQAATLFLMPLKCLGEILQRFRPENDS